MGMHGSWTAVRIDDYTRSHNQCWVIASQADQVPDLKD